MAQDLKKQESAVTDSVSQAIVTSNIPEITNASLVIEEENKGTEKYIINRLHN